MLRGLHQNPNLARLLISPPPQKDPERADCLRGLARSGFLFMVDRERTAWRTSFLEGLRRSLLLSSFCVIEKRSLLVDKLPEPRLANVLLGRGHCAVTHYATHVFRDAEPIGHLAFVMELQS